MSLFDKCSIEVKGGENKVYEFKGLNALTLLGLIAIVTFVLIRAIFAGGISFVSSILGFVFSVPGIIILGIIFVILFSNKESKEKIINFAKNFKKKEEEISEE